MFQALFCSVILELVKCIKIQKMCKEYYISKKQNFHQGMYFTFILIFFLFFLVISHLSTLFCCLLLESRIQVSFPVTAPRKPSFSSLRNARNTTQWSETIIPDRSVIS